LSIADRELHKSEEKMLYVFIRNNYDEDVGLQKRISEIQTQDESEITRIENRYDSPKL
jgi:hypothetical protein